MTWLKSSLATCLSYATSNFHQFTIYFIIKYCIFTKYLPILIHFQFSEPTVISPSLTLIFARAERGKGAGKTKREDDDDVRPCCCFEALRVPFNSPTLLLLLFNVLSCRWWRAKNRVRLSKKLIGNFECRTTYVHIN